MRRLLTSFIVSMFVLAAPPAFGMSTLLDCEKGRGNTPIQACSTIIDTESVDGKPASSQVLAIAYYQRGNAYRIQRLNERAIEDYDMATNLNPSIALAYYHKGNILRNAGDLNHAIEAYSEVISRSPGYSNAYFNRAEAYYQIGETNRAIDDYRKAMTLDPSLLQAWTALRQLGFQY